MKKSFVYVASALMLSGLLASCNAPKASSSANSSAPASSSSTPVNSSSSSTSSLTAQNLSLKYLDQQTQTLGSQPLTVYTSSQYPDIPLVNAKDMTPFLSVVKLGTAVTYEMKDNVGVMTGEDGSTAYFDFANKVITFPDLESFLNRKGNASGLDPFGGSTDDLYLHRGASRVVKGAESVADLGAHHLPMFAENGAGYLPLQTISDLFMNTLGAQFVYDGKEVFFVSGTYPKAIADLYYANPVGPRSQSLAEFTYNEFCLNGDFSYALKAKHGITSFDDYLTKTGRKADLLSTDAQVADAALAYVTYTDLDDNHSAMTSPSSYAGQGFDLSASKYKGTSNSAFQANYDRFITARTAKLGKTYLPYEEVGDTAYVTFDVFMDHTADYYTTHPTLAEAGNDTMALVEYAHSQITRDGSPITKVVMDLSCNTGGAATAAAYIASWFLNGTTVHIKDPINGAIFDQTMTADVNLDKTFDAKDSIADKKLYCLISPNSFSCGNLVPFLLRDAGTVTLLGQRSGGGTCVVDKTSLADGTLFWLSGRAELCTVKNGTYYDLDQGVEPDYSLKDPASYYDRATLTTYLDTLK